MKPDGVSRKGLPEDREDLWSLDARLKQALQISYRPLSFEELAAVLDLLRHGVFGEAVKAHQRI